MKMKTSCRHYIISPPRPLHPHNRCGHHIVAADSAVTAADYSYGSSSSNSSDDIEMTVSKIDKIWDSTDAMLNQQTFDVAVDEECVRYTCAEVVRMLDLSDDDYYMPSSCLVNHTLRCVVAVFMARFEKLQWRLDMIEKVRNTTASQYKDTCPASGSSSDGYDETPMSSADVRERELRQLAATTTDMDNRCKDGVY